MYKIYADNILIYDSTIEDFKIGKGSITLEVNKSGSFTFSIYPDHFFYDSFIRLKTVITVYKSNRIIFRGRILNDVTDYWNNKVITCEGELGFLQDSIIRPFSFYGTPEALFTRIIENHNEQVDEFKRFKIGVVTVVDANNYISRSNSEYESALSNLNDRLLEDATGGYLYITHGDDGTDPIPTINYLADFTKVSTQVIEFGSNLKNYTKTIKGEDIATAIIPLGHEVDDGNSDTEDPKLTIKSVNNGLDYVYSKDGVALYGWIFKVVSWDDVTVAANLKAKAEAYVENIVKQNITIELNAVDLHLLDSSIESFNIGEYVRVYSTPHNFDSTLLCNKLTLDILKPDNDTYILGHTYTTLTEKTAKIAPTITKIDTQNRNASAAINNLISNIYYPETTQLNGDKIYPQSISTSHLDLPNIFANDITMTGTFTTVGEVFIEPGIEEIEAIRKHYLGEEFIASDKIALYDFNNNGSIDTSDYLLARRAFIGTTSLASWSGAKKSTVVITINVSDPQKAISISGVNMWGREVERYFGLNMLFSGNDAKAQFTEMLKQNEYITEIESRISALEKS